MYRMSAILKGKQAMWWTAVVTVPLYVQGKISKCNFVLNKPILSP